MPARKDKSKRNGSLRIAGYVRVSSQRQATEGDSLTAQQHEIEQEVEFRQRRENWQLAGLEFYIDAGRSAKDQNRPELQRLKRDIAANKVDIVICFKLDRITRSLKDFVDLWALFEDHDVDVISLREKFDTSMPTGEAMVQLIMVFAQLERKMTAERTYSIMRDRVERGLWNGGHILGYRSKPNEPGELEIDEEGAALVRLIFDSFEQLGSSGAVTRMLSTKGIRYPSYLTRSGKRRGGNLFAKQKVTGILRNPVYVGKVRWGKATHNGNHAPLIGEEQFKRVQVQLAELARRRTGTRKKPKGRHYLLTGVIRCACGASMVGYSTVGRNRRHFYYACTRQNHEGGRYSCTARRIPAEVIEHAVLGRIHEISQRVEARERIVEHALSTLDSESDKLFHEEDVQRRQLQKTRADISRLVEVLKNLGSNGLSSVHSELVRLEVEERGLQRQLRELAKRREPLTRVMDDARKFVRSWGDVAELLEAASDEEKTLLIRHYVEVVELHPSGPNGKTGTYALRLFPEIRPDGGFDWEGRDPPSQNGDGSRGVKYPIGGNTEVPETATPLTGASSVWISDEKAPRTRHQRT